MNDKTASALIAPGETHKNRVRKWIALGEAHKNRFHISFMLRWLQLLHRRVLIHAVYAAAPCQ